MNILYYLHKCFVESPQNHCEVQWFIRSQDSAHSCAHSHDFLYQKGTRQISKGKRHVGQSSEETRHWLSRVPLCRLPTPGGVIEDTFDSSCKLWQHVWSTVCQGSSLETWCPSHKEGWALKNWCFRAVVLEKTWESLGPQGDQTSQS